MTNIHIDSLTAKLRTTLPVLLSYAWKQLIAIIVAFWLVALYISKAVFFPVFPIPAYADGIFALALLLVVCGSVSLLLIKKKWASAARCVIAILLIPVFFMHVPVVIVFEKLKIDLFKTHFDECKKRTETLSSGMVFSICEWTDNGPSASGIIYNPADEFQTDWHDAKWVGSLNAKKYDLYAAPMHTRLIKDHFYDFDQAH